MAIYLVVSSYPLNLGQPNYHFSLRYTLSLPPLSVLRQGRIPLLRVILRMCTIYL